VPQEVKPSKLLPLDTWENHPYLGPYRGRHFCEVSPGRTYMMDAGWIDTDNKIDVEPHHLYGD